MKKRQALRGTGLETLEDRALMSVGGILSRNLQRAAMIGPVNGGNGAANLRAGQGANRANRMLGRAGTVAQVPVNTSFNVVTPNQPVSAQTPQLNVPQTRRPVVNTNTTPTTSTTTSTSYALNPYSVGLGAAPTSVSTVAGGYAALRPGKYTSVVPQNGAPVGSIGTTPTLTSTNLTSPASNAVTTTPANPGQAPLAPSGFMGAKSMIAADPSSNFTPPPFDMLDGAVLSPAQVASLKTAAANLVSNHTYGTDPAKDKAAVDAFQGTLNDLAMNVWTQVNATTKTSAVALSKAADDFAASYTGGTDVAKDTAAWKTLNTAMADFTRSIQNPKAPADAPPQNAFLGDSPWMPVPVMMSGSNLRYLASGLLDGQALSKDDLNGLKSSIDTFASTYTSGTDAAKDLAAGQSMVNSLGDLMVKRWERLAPAVVSDAVNLASTAEAAVSRAPVLMSIAKGLMPKPTQQA